MHEHGASLLVDRLQVVMPFEGEAFEAGRVETREEDLVVAPRQAADLGQRIGAGPQAERGAQLLEEQDAHCLLQLFDARSDDERFDALEAGGKPVGAQRNVPTAILIVGHEERAVEEKRELCQIAGSDETLCEGLEPAKLFGERGHAHVRVIAESPARAIQGQDAAMEQLGGLERPIGGG